jgi:hypothetical protein
MDKLRELVARYPVEGDLRREVTMSIKRLMDLAGLSRRAPPQAAGAVSAHLHQCAYAQGLGEAIALNKLSLRDLIEHLMAQQPREAASTTRVHKRDQEERVRRYRAHHASFNNTIIDHRSAGQRAVMGDPGGAGFKGSRKSRRCSAGCGRAAGKAAQ